MLTLQIAFRNLWRQKRRSLFTGLMMAGGFWLCSAFLGLSEGSYGSIIDFFTSDHTGHLQIHRKGYLDNPTLRASIGDWSRIQSVLSSDDRVACAAPRVYSAALVFIGEKTTGARIVGVDPDLEAATTSLKRKVSKGSYFHAQGENTVLVGMDIARALDLKIGDQIALVGQGADGSIANDLFTLTGIIGSGGGGGDRNVYLRLSDAQRFLAMEGLLHEVAVRLKDIRLAREESAILASRLGDANLEVEPWQVVEKDFYKAMSADKQGGYLFQVIFMILVGLGVLNTVLMNVLERVPEYGLLKALGTKSSTITGMILWEMLFLSLISLVPGAVLGGITNYWMAAHGLKLPQAVTYGGMDYSTLYGQVSWIVFLLPAVLVILTAVLVCVPAAFRIWRLTPIDALRRT